MYIKYSDKVLSFCNDDYQLGSVEDFDSVCLDDIVYLAKKEIEGDVYMNASYEDWLDIQSRLAKP